MSSDRTIWLRATDDFDPDDIADMLEMIGEMYRCKVVAVPKSIHWMNEEDIQHHLEDLIDQYEVDV
jgi:hypothetical protein